jgi:hypothetical protein
MDLREAEVKYIFLTSRELRSKNYMKTRSGQAGSTDFFTSETQSSIKYLGNSETYILQFEKEKSSEISPIVLGILRQFVFLTRLWKALSSILSAGFS